MWQNSKKLSALLMLLCGVASCTIAEQKEDRYCLEYITHQVIREECIGGRGVGPQICIPRVDEKLLCVKYEYTE